MKERSLGDNGNKRFFGYIQSSIIAKAAEHELMSEQGYNDAISDLLKYRAEGDAEKTREIKNKLIQANMRFIIKFASRYNVTPDKYGDLISECVIGFDRALDTFDGSSRITTYAFFWMRHKVNAILRDHSVYHPQYLYERKEVGSGNVVSLNVPDLNGKEPQVVDENTEPPDEIINRSQQLKILNKALGYLKERERKILRLRFGLETGEDHTLDSIGKKMGLCRERIRQIEEVALKKLSQHIKIQRLKVVLYD